MSSTELRRRLLRWFDAAKRDLPWRFRPGRADPYRVWVSEAMLQQTQVAAVIPYYRRFLARFPTLEALAGAREDEVLAAWSGLGYYARARALRRAAREALERHGGLPRTIEALRALPGFGPYTAAAVASIAFGVRAAAVDGNVGRVLSRLHAVEAPRGSSAFRERVQGLAAEIVESPAVRRPGDLNQALIELGALLCRPRGARCDRCPVASGCAARLAGEVDRYPRRGARAVPVPLRLAVGVVLDEGRVLLLKRPRGGLFGGMWGPPVVLLAPGEDPAEALSAGIEREPSANTGGFSRAGTVERRLTHRLLEMDVLVAPLRRAPKGRSGWKLVDTGQLGDIAVPSAFRAALALGLQEGSAEVVRQAGAKRTTLGRGRGAAERRETHDSRTGEAWKGANNLGWGLTRRRSSV